MTLIGVPNRYSMLEQTSVDQYEKSKGKSGEDDSE